MERTERRLVQCLLFTALVLFAIYPTKGSEVDTPKITHHSVRSPSPSVFCPVRSPVADGVKQPSNITHVPLASHHSLGFTPMVSPEPHAALKKLNITFAPLPVSSSVISPAHEVREPSNTRPLPFASRPPMSISAPVISPTPHEIENSTHSSLPSHPFPLQSSPLISPSPYEAEPSNFTYSPHSSHPLPSESSPEMSPAPHEVKDPSGIKQSPLPSVSKPPGLPPVISPTPQDEVKEPKNISHSPFSSASPVIISPPPHGLTNPSILVPSPLASMPKPSASSPVISPAPHELKDPANITSELPPMLSPAPHEFTNPSPISPAPLASKPKLSESSSLISPAPQELKDPPNIRSAPLSSHPNHSGVAPAVRPAQHDLKGPSNIVHAPLPSQASPAVSPAPHKLNNSSTVINSPLASHEITSGASPVLSPVPQEVNDPINVTHSPLPSHSLPLELAPEISPAPHKVSPAHNVTHSPLPTGVSPARSPTPNEVKQPSNVTRSPWPTHPFPSGSTPAMSPAPHELKDTSNITHSPLPSHPHPSEISPSISPSSHGVSNPVNMTNAPSVSHPQPPSSPVRYEAKNSTGTKHSPLASHVHSESTILAPAPAPIVSNSKPSATIRSGNSAPSSLIPGHVLSPGQSDTSPVSPENEHRNHAPSPFIGGSISSNQFPSYPPVVAPESNQRHHTPSPYLQGPSRSPTLPPSGSLRKGTQAPMPVWILPPPPPDLDCKSLMCLGSYTYPATGSICACVLPMKVGLRLSIAVYTFFPLVSELACEIASGVAVNQSQVRIMGANVATEDPEKTIVLIDLVPFGGSFNTSTALVIFGKFWQKQVPIKSSDFGDYEVLYVSYPGLPPSPPVAPDVNVDGTLGKGGNGAIIKPLGVDVGKKKGKVSGTSIAIVVLSSVIVVVIIVGVAWALLWKCRKHSHQPPSTSQQALPSLAKLSAAGAGPGALGSGPSSTTASFSSSIPAYTGSAKTFSLSEMERATHRFSESRIIGEGGFGRVYRGTLEDGTMVAVKVLKRDDQQGGREFLAEVEMLSRLHHRNLVKLIGICTEENVRCLIYELIPNGSVESHLHGSDKETSQLDWSARLKIALGAARGLAYLHEDSSPRVIHRDFKSSNILLEHDFTPKVSDFGLARAALEEQNDHISTRVMGTFGYVAPEYAMTGHLLVKSDVYSYGVVLLELLTGRKPVDMSQPPGQETLVSWARPHLTGADGLSTLIDPALGPDVSLDSVAKVAAIASMCVQPEVSHRPFMGEVVQALKLVYNESDGHRRSFSQDDSCTKDLEMRISPVSGPESHIFCTSTMFANNVSGSFRRYSNSGPLRDDGGRKFWQKVRGFSSGSMAGVGFARDRRLGPDVEHGGQWP